MLPWHVVSNAKNPLPHQYLSIVDHRHELTIWLSAINLMLLLWLAVILCRRCFGSIGHPVDPPSLKWSDLKSVFFGIKESRADGC